jgi:GH24 family phage-related lysozyme (muramidase)
MKTSKAGIDLIKKFEGCRLTAYKPVSTEKYYTIGYGHYGADVAPDMRITQEQADAFLVSDLKRFEESVNASKMILNQNQFDALVSFTYNCGAANLRKLVANRTLAQIADALLSYNKGGGKVLTGLVRRRQAERALFLSEEKQKDECPYEKPKNLLKQGQKNVRVKWLQWMLNHSGMGYNVEVDGAFGAITAGAVLDFMREKRIVVVESTIVEELEKCTSNTT